MFIFRLLFLQYFFLLLFFFFSLGFPGGFLLLLLISSHFKRFSVLQYSRFSKHRPSGPSGPMLSTSWYVRLSVCPSGPVRLSVCSLLRYRLNIFLPPLPKVGCPIFSEIQNPWGKVRKRSGLTFEHFCLIIVKNRRAKKKFFFADFSLQKMVETMLPDGLEVSGSLILAYL